MRLLLSTLVFMLVLLIAFLVGVFGDAPGLAMPAFCLWTPSAIMVGYALKTAGVKLRSPVQASTLSTAPRQKTTASTRVQN